MKTKFFIVVLVSLVILLVITAVIAIPGKEKAKEKVKLPKNAKEVAPGVFYLGKAATDKGIVEGYAFVRYKEKPAKPETECGNGICEPGENARKCPADCGGGEEPNTKNCYTFLAKGAKWKTVEPYIVDSTNSEGLSASFISSNLASDISKWESGLCV